VVCQAWSAKRGVSSGALNKGHCMKTAPIFGGGQVFLPGSHCETAFATIVSPPTEHPQYRVRGQICGQLQRLDITCAQKPMRALIMPPQMPQGNVRMPTAGNFPSRI